ncbi:MAG TPA: hypothetical protein VN893_00370, partial [Bryobacteraceae bacterium]|nr:hypothetical protein [Bryobacteraceae bacterium]
NIEIWPAQADNIYVPTYDPDIVYFGSGGALGGGVEALGPPCVIGVWLNLDINWHHRKIYYHGWDHGPEWVTRSRPDVKLSPVYVNRSFQQVATGRAGRSVKVNRAALNRYSSVHRDLTFNQAGTGGAPAGNKMIERNMDTRDPRIDAFRGAEQPAVRTGAGAEQPAVRIGAGEQQPAAKATRAPAPRHEAIPVSPPSAGPQPQKAPAPESRPPEIARPPAPPPEREIHEPERVAPPPSNEAFGNRGPFEPQAASQRGQASRSEMAQPAPRHESPAPQHAPSVRDK